MVAAVSIELRRQSAIASELTVRQQAVFRIKNFVDPGNHRCPPERIGDLGEGRARDSPSATRSRDSRRAAARSLRQIGRVPASASELAFPDVSGSN
jgi:hypothetical protein